MSTLFQSLHSESPRESQDHTASEPPPAKRLKGLAAVISQIQKGKQSESETTVTQTPRPQIQKEIDSYMYLDFPPVDAEVDPLAWWKVERGQFPNIANLAKKYLCICGTSVPSEQSFSTASHIASQACGRLLPENVSKLLFLARNID